MAHAFAAYTRERDFHTAPIADHALVLDALVFSTRAFPIARWTEDPFTEKPTFLWLERSIVDRLRILDFAFTPGAHGVARSDPDCDLIEADRSLFAY
jgi:hypothetical protein